MTHPIRGLGLAASLVLISTVAVVPKASAQSTSSTAANVYVQVGGPEGAVYGYNASSTGQLSAISGSPFSLGSAIVGSNGSQLFTLGQTQLHSYGIGSNGAIGSQMGDTDVYNYGGGDCGDSSDASYQNVNSAELDHSGKFVYVLLQNGPNNCAAFQSYAIGNSGNFTFLGDIDQTGINIEPVSTSLSLPSILGNETFGYDTEVSGHEVTMNGFQRESSGELQWLQFSQTGPGDAPDGGWCPFSPDASPTGNYLVAQVGECDSGGNEYLASYTVDSQGNISSTNTVSNMPMVSGPETVFSPSGELLANWGTLGGGITLYNFNGAAPLTPYTTLLNGVTIRQVAWDGSNHLYAISSSEYQTADATNELYVLTVTPTSAIEDSSVSIAEPYTLVVSNPSSAPTGGACTAPSTAGINVCSPAENASATSPVSINAAATMSGGVYRFSLWNGNTKLLNEDGGIMHQSLSLAPGSYDLVFDAENSSDVHEYVTRNITVGGGSCAAPPSNGVNVCSPAQGSTVTSPVSINAAATVSGGVYRFSLWNGNTKLLNEDSSVMDQTLSLAAGSYKLTFDAENTAGVHAYATLDVTVK
ncbi:MAG: Ig-like domain-containing protein [Terracidiphilus sp.]